MVDILADVVDSHSSTGGGRVTSVESETVGIAVESGVQLHDGAASLASRPGCFALYLAIDVNSAPASDRSSRVGGVNRILKNRFSLDVAVVSVVAHTSLDFTIGTDGFAAVDTNSFSLLVGDAVEGLDFVVVDRRLKRSTLSVARSINSSAEVVVRSVDSNVAGECISGVLVLGRINASVRIAAASARLRRDSCALVGGVQLCADRGRIAHVEAGGVSLLVDGGGERNRGAETLASGELGLGLESSVDPETSVASDDRLSVVLGRRRCEVGSLDVTEVRVRAAAASDFVVARNTVATVISSEECADTAVDALVGGDVVSSNLSREGSALSVASNASSSLESSVVVSDDSDVAFGGSALGDDRRCVHACVAVATASRNSRNSINGSAVVVQSHCGTGSSRIACVEGEVVVLAVHGGHHLDSSAFSVTSVPSDCSEGFSVDVKTIPAGDRHSVVSGVDRVLKNRLILDVAVVCVIADTSLDFAISEDGSASIVDAKGFHLLFREALVCLDHGDGRGVQSDIRLQGSTLSIARGICSSAVSVV